MTTPPERYAKNAPGPFYVKNDCCIVCRAPQAEAPELIAHDEDQDYHHCYFKKQPTTPDELDQAISACHVSCINALRYAGDDPVVIKRLRKLRLGHVCDQLENKPWWRFW